MIFGECFAVRNAPFRVVPLPSAGGTPFLYESYKHINRIDGRALYSGAWITEKR